MGLDLHVEQKPDYLLITVRGGFDLQSAKETSRHSLKLLESHKQSKALVDIRNMTGPLSTMERYDYATFLAEIHAQHVLATGAPLQVAYVGSESVIDPGRFGETVAANRGVHIKATTEMSEALAWLGVS